jgi:adenosine 3'-phospho 5'-phosphosulfate transporter B2
MYAFQLQAFAVVLSCIFFNHAMTALGVIGVLVVFLSIFLRIYCSYRLKQVRSNQSVQALIQPASGSIIKI